MAIMARAISRRWTIDSTKKSNRVRSIRCASLSHAPWKLNNKWVYLVTISPWSIRLKLKWRVKVSMRLKSQMWWTPGLSNRNPSFLRSSAWHKFKKSRPIATKEWCRTRRGRYSKLTSSFWAKAQQVQISLRLAKNSRVSWYLIESSSVTWDAISIYYRSAQLTTKGVSWSRSNRRCSVTRGRSIASRICFGIEMLWTKPRPSTSGKSSVKTRCRLIRHLLRITTIRASFSTLRGFWTR